jgi:L-serine dehydratase
MIAMAAQCHLASAEHIVPVTIEYMEPFFKHDDKVDAYIPDEIIPEENDRQQALIKKAVEESRRLANRANPITEPFGEAVVGGSSLGVGSPTNCARIAHFLAKGEVKKVKIELYAEMFARRAINVPGILMAAVDGYGTSNAEAYKNSLDVAREKGVEVEILEIPEHSVQRVTIEATEGNSMVESINSGGARLILKAADPSMDRAREIAKELNIVIIDD